MNAAALVDLHEVSRIFQVGDQRVHALREVTLGVGAGEYVSIMGPSGSGKSTLLNLIGLLDRPTSGDYTLSGRDVSLLEEGEQARVRREQIGFVFQFFHLVPRLTAAENVELPLTLAGVPRGDRRSRVHRMLEALGLVREPHFLWPQLLLAEVDQAALDQLLELQKR